MAAIRVASQRIVYYLIVTYDALRGHVKIKGRIAILYRRER